MRRRLALFAIGLMVILSAPAALAAEGTYISAPIGGDEVVSFTTLAIENQYVPTGASIAYSVSGSASNYQAWSTPQQVSNSMDLRTLSELTDSKYLKVKAIFASSTLESPSVGGLTVGYTTAEGSTASTTAQGASLTNSESTSEANTTTTDAGASQEANNTKFVNASQTTSQQSDSVSLTTLASTGGNLWINLLIAALVSAIVAWVLLRRPKQSTAGAN